MKTTSEHDENGNSIHNQKKEEYKYGIENLVDDNEQGF